jgi:hypothetical protein
VEAMIPKEVFLFSHAIFGTWGALAAVWVLVETLNLRAETLNRVRFASILVAVLMWLSYFLGGYFYVNFYVADRAIILAGPWPWAHRFATEAKEHLFFVLLLLATYLPIVARDPYLLKEKANRVLMMTVSGLVGALVMAMDGFGAIIILGVKMGLLQKG